MRTALVSAGLAVAIALTMMSSASAEPTGTPSAPVETQVIDRDRVEALDAGTIDNFNASLDAAGNVQISDGTVALVFLVDGTVLERRADGTQQVRESAQAAGRSAVAAAGVVDEIKKVIAGCLGVSLTATGFWASIVEELKSWDKAVKFLVRRLGLVGAVSCAGGIVWQYI